jgi:glutamyl-tRNA reductase
LPRDHLGEAAAVRHLFRVACRLDSAILGDVQIMKDAVAMAAAAGTLGRTLEHTTGQAIRIGKRARAGTAIGHGAASVGSALAGMLAGRPVSAILVIGAGDLARNVGRHLQKRGAGEITFVSRTRAHAAAAAEHCGGRVRPWAELEDALIDAIRQRREEALATRRAAVPFVEAMIADELAPWKRWRTRLPLDGVLEALYREVDEALREVAKALAGRPQLTRATSSASSNGRSSTSFVHTFVGCATCRRSSGPPTDAEED